MSTSYAVRRLLAKTADVAGLPALGAALIGGATAPEGEGVDYGLRTGLGAGTLGLIGQSIGQRFGGNADIYGGLGGVVAGSILGRLWANSAHDKAIERHVHEYARRQQEEMARQAEKQAALPTTSAVRPQLPGWAVPAGAAVAAGGLAYGMSGKDQSGEDHSVRNALMAAAPTALAAHGLWSARRPLAQSFANWTSRSGVLSPATKGKINTWAGNVNSPTPPPSTTPTPLRQVRANPGQAPAEPSQAAADFFAKRHAPAAPQT